MEETIELKRISTRAAEVIWEPILRLRSWPLQAVDSRAMTAMIDALGRGPRSRIFMGVLILRVIVLSS